MSEKYKTGFLETLKLFSLSRAAGSRLQHVLLKVLCSCKNGFIICSKVHRLHLLFIVKMVLRRSRSTFSLLDTVELVFSVQGHETMRNLLPHRKMKHTESGKVCP